MRTDRFGKALIFVSFVLAASFCFGQVTVSYVKGTAWYRANSGSPWTAVEAGRSFAMTGFVKTDAASSLELYKEGRYRVVLSANTLARLDSLKASGKDSADHVTIQTGKVISDILAIGTDFQVRTKGTLMGVRGTQFVVVANAEGSTLLGVREGAVLSFDRPEAGQGADGFLVSKGQKRLSDKGSGGAPEAIAKGDAEYLDFAAFDALEAGKEPESLYDHYAKGQDRLFSDWKRADLDDLHLFELADLDNRWQFILSENQAWLRELDKLGAKK